MIFVINLDIFSKRLKTLDLFSNEIRAGGVYYLTKALRNSLVQSLTELILYYVSCNPSGYIGIEYLRNLLKFNKVCTELIYKVTKYSFEVFDLKFMMSFGILFITIVFIYTRNLNGLPIISQSSTRVVSPLEIGGGDIKTVPYSPLLRGVPMAGSHVKWPGGIVPYEISTAYSAAQQNTILEAMRTLENSTIMANGSACLTFRPATPADYPYYLQIENGVGCSSYVGRYTGYTLNRTVTLEIPSCIYTGVIMHELIHALGFYHEQSRPDRDTYVKINWGTIIPGMQNNFIKYNASDVVDLYTPYDYDSIMHYGRKFFSVNGSDTIEPLSPPTAVIGLQIALSPIDIQEIQIFYDSNTDNGVNVGIIVGSVVGGVVGLLVVAGVIIGGLFLAFGTSAPLISNAGYVGFGASKLAGVDLFRSGQVAGSFLKDGVWHSTQNTMLGFYPNAGNTVFGKGTDSLGNFSARGVYSPRTQKIAFDKVYQPGLHDAGPNRARTMKVQAKWNENSKLFEGKYYLKDGSHREKGQYILRHLNQGHNVRQY
ncbi:hypothetical protein I4U23_027057 [Adineta vaga]|nr:hypothetical protein I4U23_027057 [Adineta vaga]